MKIAAIDFLNRLKTARYSSVKNSVDAPCTKAIKQIAHQLYSQGFISSYRVYKPNPGVSFERITVILKQGEGADLISNIKVFSTPKKKIRVKYSELCKFDFKGKEYFIFTTRGLLTGLQCVQQGLGGILAFRI